MKKNRYVIARTMLYAHTFVTLKRSLFRRATIITETEKNPVNATVFRNKRTALFYCERLNDCSMRYEYYKVMPLNSVQS